MPRYFIEVSYKGTKYSGFQIQQNAITIQSEVERALLTCARQPFQLTGASRTDAGVHALQNFFHFDVKKNLKFSNPILEKTLYSLNSILSDDIVIKRIFQVEDKLNCRFNAVSREYKYYIYQKKNPFYKDTAYFFPYKIDFEKLQQAADIILNTKNFESFSKRNTQVNNFICSIKKSEWVKEKDFIIYNVIANRFLRGMVKGLVSTMLKIASGKISLNEFRGVIKSNNSSNVFFSVPSKGLFLVEVKYDNK